jgi:hypothetical protein
VDVSVIFRNNFVVFRAAVDRRDRRRVVLMGQLRQRQYLPFLTHAIESLEGAHIWRVEFLQGISGKPAAVCLRSNPAPVCALHVGVARHSRAGTNRQLGAVLAGFSCSFTTAARGCT